jgi:hypothetical protein
MGKHREGYHKEYYKKNREKLLKQFKKRHEENKEHERIKKREYVKKNRLKLLEKKKNYNKYNPEVYKKRNKKRVKATWTLNDHLRRNLIKKKPCELCDEIKVQGHHYDYDKPLDVYWLCREHHAYIHRLLRVLKEVA